MNVLQSRFSDLWLIYFTKINHEVDYTRLLG